MRALLARTLDEAVAAKAEFGRACAILAGGQSLSLMLYHKLTEPELLLALQRCATLNQVQEEPGTVRIGATVTTAAVIEHEAVRRDLPVLAQALLRVASPHVRNLGTLVGSLCHNGPGADAPVVLLALAAEVEARSSRGARRIPLGPFFAGYLETALAPDEIAEAVRVPTPGDDWRWRYVKHQVRSVDYALLNVAAGFRFAGDVCIECRIAVGGLGATPHLLADTGRRCRGLGRRELVAAAPDLAATAITEAAERFAGDAEGAYQRRLLGSTLVQLTADCAT